MCAVPSTYMCMVCQVAVLLPLPENADVEDLPITLVDAPNGRKGGTNVDDFAYLQEFVLPTLLPVLHALCNKVDKQGYPEVPSDYDQDPAKFNPVRYKQSAQVLEHKPRVHSNNHSACRWLAQGLLRGKAMEALKIADADDRSLYEDRLDQVSHLAACALHACLLRPWCSHLLT